MAFTGYEACVGKFLLFLLIRINYNVYFGMRGFQIIFKTFHIRICEYMSMNS